MPCYGGGADVHRQGEGGGAGWGPLVGGWGVRKPPSLYQHININSPHTPDDPFRVGGFLRQIIQAAYCHSLLFSQGSRPQRHRLRKRRQRVVVEGVESEWVPVDSSVPQGTVLGGTLFGLYVDDIDEAVGAHGARIAGLSEPRDAAAEWHGGNAWGARGRYRRRAA